MFHLLISNQPGPCSEADEKKERKKERKTSTISTTDDTISNDHINNL